MGCHCSAYHVSASDTPAPRPPRRPRRGLSGMGLGSAFQGVRVSLPMAALLVVELQHARWYLREFRWCLDYGDSAQVSPAALRYLSVPLRGYRSLMDCCLELQVCTCASALAMWRVLQMVCIPGRERFEFADCEGSRIVAIGSALILHMLFAACRFAWRLQGLHLDMCSSYESRFA